MIESWLFLFSFTFVSFLLSLVKDPIFSPSHNCTEDTPQILNTNDQDQILVAVNKVFYTTRQQEDWIEVIVRVSIIIIAIIIIIIFIIIVIIIIIIIIIIIRENIKRELQYHMKK
jgi:hypothetical protein